MCVCVCGLSWCFRSKRSNVRVSLTRVSFALAYRVFFRTDIMLFGVPRGGGLSGHYADHVAGFVNNLAVLICESVSF